MCKIPYDAILGTGWMRQTESKIEICGSCFHFRDRDPWINCFLLPVGLYCHKHRIYQILSLHWTHPYFRSTAADIQCLGSTGGLRALLKSPQWRWRKWEKVTSFHLPHLDFSAVSGIWTGKLPIANLNLKTATALVFKVNWEIIWYSNTFYHSSQSCPPLCYALPSELMILRYEPVHTVLFTRPRNGSTIVFFLFADSEYHSVFIAMIGISCLASQLQIKFQRITMSHERW